MLRVEHPRLTAAVVSLGAGLLILAMGVRVGGIKRIDGALFGILAGKPGEVMGEGTIEEPWGIETQKNPQAVEPLRVFHLSEDPDGYFEQMPPPPSDLMVVLDRLAQAGVGPVGFGYPLQWENPDTLAVETMRAAMDRLERTVIGYAIKDSTVADPVPPPFLKASMAHADVRGDSTKLPVVNSVRGLVPEFGGDETWAGFLRIETEEAEQDRAYLVARWSDRIVFSLPVVMEMARLGLSPEDDVVVRMGRDIRLGSSGPRIPIDFRGRVRLPEDPADSMDVPATAMISDEVPEAFLEDQVPVLFADQRLLGDKAERIWAERLPRLAAAIQRAPVAVGSMSVPRLPLVVELIALITLSLGVVALPRKKSLGLRLAMTLGAGLVVAVALVVLIRFGIGPMPAAFLSIPAAAFVSVLLFDDEAKVEVVRPQGPSKPPAKRAGGKKAKRRGRKRS